MPATYAHYRFGLEVLHALPDGFHKSIITKNKVNYDLFMIGLHGPDILFFYKPFQKNRIQSTGFRLHSNPARGFFEHGLSVVQSFKKKRDYQAAYSYLCGVVCHFVLDHSCHPYIYNLTDTTTFYHSDIESEFDRMLLLEDHQEPYGYPLIGHIHNSPYRAYIISQFYDCTAPKDMFQVIHSFEYYNDLLCSHGFRRKAFEILLCISRNTYTRKMMISAYPNYQLKDTCKELHQMFDDAVFVAARLITELSDNMHERKPLDDIYQYSFGRN